MSTIVNGFECGCGGQHWEEQFETLFGFSPDNVSSNNTACFDSDDDLLLVNYDQVRHWFKIGGSIRVEFGHVCFVKLDDVKEYISYVNDLV